MTRLCKRAPSLIGISFGRQKRLGVTPGVGNYFRPRATLLLYQCLAGHISVKKAESKLKKLAFAGRMWPAGRMLPPPVLHRMAIATQIYNIFCYFAVHGGLCS